MSNHNEICKSEACLARRSLLINISAAVIALLTLSIGFQLGFKLMWIVSVLGCVSIREVRSTINTAHFSEADA